MLGLMACGRLLMGMTGSSSSDITVPLQLEVARAARLLQVSELPEFELDSAVVYMFKLVPK